MGLGPLRLTKKREGGAKMQDKNKDKQRKNKKLFNIGYVALALLSSAALWLITFLLN